MRNSNGIVAVTTTPRKWSRCVPLIAAVLAALTVVGSSDALAQQAGASRFKPLDRSGGAFVAHRQPLSLLAQEQVKVVVTLSAESVAEVRARTAGHGSAAGS